MALQDVHSYIAGQWRAPDGAARPIADAATGIVFAQVGQHLDSAAALSYAKEHGGPALRRLTFHDRARMLKAVAQHLNAYKGVLYEASYATGATRRDHAFDIDGGIGTVFVFSSKGRRDMPDARIYTEGPVESLSQDGSFLGQHVCVPRQGVAVHINAFNFPLWGMLEKLAPTLLAGMPAIVKPATATCYVTELAVRLILDSGILPQGALQLVAGSTGDLLDQLTCQDVVSFTGSADTAMMLRQTPNLVQHSVHFIAEQDSLNASLLAPDVAPDTPEFDVFLNEVLQEMTVKAGQKCTAIRRIMVPQEHLETVAQALKARLSQVVVGDPRDPKTTMGALVSEAQRKDVLAKLALLEQDARKIFGTPEAFEIAGSQVQQGAFLPPILLACDTADTAKHVHSIEAFGPVSTLIGFRDLDHGMALLNKGGGSLVASVITQSAATACAVVEASGAYHGRLYFNNRDSMAAATGHGAPMPHMIHGGPGRAGGGEELGGIRGAMAYMQRTAVQGSPEILSAVTGRWMPGAPTASPPTHPFTRPYEALAVGDTLTTPARTVSVDDIEHFAAFTGDTFYAHMDDDAAARNPFFPGRVAHGYLLLSFAAGLFVEPSEGPVLANTGLDALRFRKPVQPGDAIHVQLTVKHKTPRTPEYGEVRWHVTLRNQDTDVVAEYELLTMNACAGSRDPGL